MKALLVERETGGQGHRHLLDPFRQTLFSVGRSSQCDIVVKDSRASRHHSDIRWTGRQWEVADRGSTNGTYVNGTRIQHPVALSLGDSVSIGNTVLVLTQYIPPTQEQPMPRAGFETREQGIGLESKAQGQDSAVEAVFWLAQALVAVSLVCLAAGAFLPWFRVTGSLARSMESLIQGVAEVVSSLLGEDLLSVTQEIDGLQGFGRFSMGIAAVCLVMLVADLFALRRSAVPGIVYMLASLGAAGVMVADLLSLRDMVDQAQSITLLFGVELADVVEAFGQFIEVEITLLPGTYFTLVGLGCLLLGAIARSVASLMNRRQRE